MKNDRALAVLLILVGVLLLLLAFQILIHHTLHWDWNAIRLERTAALAAGEPLYPSADRGPILNQIYGPVAVLLYLPTLLFARPTAVIVCGQLIAVLSFFLPVLWLHLRGRRDLAGFLGFLAFTTLTLDLWPLTYTAFTIHVDAPALGLGALAGGLLLGRSLPSRRRLLASAVCAVLAVWTKQVMVAVGLLLPLYLGLAWGRRVAVRYVVQLVVIGAVSLVLALIFCGPPEALWFHLVVVPGQQPWRWGGGLGALLEALERCFESSVLAWALVALTAVLHLAERRGRESSWRDWLQANSWVVFWLLALGNLPLALMGRAKVGGDVNAFSYSVYFLVLGATLGLVALIRQGAAATPWPRLARATLVAILVLLLPLMLLLQEGELWDEPFVAAALPHELAFDYARAHPGEIYFPRLVLASYLAEGRIYHSGTGLLDRILGGMAIDREHLAAHLPEHLRGVAFYENGYVTEKDLLPFPELSRSVRDPELPGFVVFVRP